MKFNLTLKRSMFDSTRCCSFFVWRGTSVVIALPLQFIIPDKADWPNEVQSSRRSKNNATDRWTKGCCVNCVGIEFQDDLSGCFENKLTKFEHNCRHCARLNRILRLIYQIQKFFIGFVIAFRPCLRSFPQRHVWRSVPCNQEAYTPIHILKVDENFTGAMLW